MNSQDAPPRALPLRLALSLWLVLLAHFNPDGAAGARFVYLVRSIAEHHALNVDAWVTRSYNALLPPDIFALNGHAWVDTNPGLAFLATPVWTIVTGLARLIPHGELLLADPAGYLLAHFLTTATTVMLATVATAMLLYRWVLLRTGSRHRATLAATLYALGTNAFFLSGLLLQNVPITLCTLVLFLAATDPDAFLPTRHDTRRALGLGFVAGLGILMDLSIVPAILCLAWPLLTAPSSLTASHPKSRVAANRALWMTLGGLAPVVALLWYQWACFGDAFLPAQSYYLSGGVTGSGFARLPDPRVILHVLLSPGSGFFAVIPAMIPALWLLVRKQRSRERSIALSLTAIYLLYAGGIPTSATHGYFGPRYLLPIVPILVATLVIEARRLTAPWTLAAIVASFAINIMGAQNGIYIGGLAGVPRTIALWLTRGPWLPAVDQLRGDFGLTSATPWGIFVALAVSLGIIWWPWLRPAQRDTA